ncbi:MAG: AMP-binding protein [Arenicellales bacterium]
MAPDIASRTVYTMLAERSASGPEAFALLAPGRDALSFGALMRQIDELRGRLNGLGLGRGDRIVVPAPRGPETATAVLAVCSCATCIPMHPSATPSEWRSTLLAGRAKAVLAPKPVDPAIHNIARELGVSWLQGSTTKNGPAGRFSIEVAPAASADHPGLPEPGDIALILRTSGTTSRPKLVPAEHRHLVARIEKVIRLQALTSADRCLNLMPLCYGHGLLSGTMSSLAAGGSVICPPDVDADTFLRCLREFRPTWYTGGPSYHGMIAEWLHEQPDTGRSLRFARSSAAPLPAQVRERLERMLGIRLLEGYGTSETGTITANPRDGRIKSGTVGISGDDDVVVADESCAPLPPGEVGEVLVRGPTVFTGYENDPEANRESFHDGWFRTGDFGFLDEEGYLTLTGRATEIINRGGEKVSPSEVDAALLEHPGVAEAATFPIPHATLGEEVAAAVKLRAEGAVSERELQRFLLQRLVPFKVPRRIVFVAELPKGPTGKPLRQTLAERLRTNAALRGNVNRRP